MNPGFSDFLSATPRDRRDVFLGAATRLGTPEQNIEKDFWVAWTLDQMMEDLRRDYRRMAGMIIGDPPEFDEVMASIAALEEALNR